MSAPSAPAPLIPVKSFSSTILPFYQHLPYFTLGPSSAEHLPLGWVQQGEDTELCRGLKWLMLLPQQIYSSLHGLNVPFGIFFTRKNIYFGRGKRKTEDKFTHKSKNKVWTQKSSSAFLDDSISKRMNP